MSYFNDYGSWHRLLHDLNLDWIVRRINKNAKDIDEGIHNNIDNVAKEINNDAIVKHLVDQGKVKVVRAYYSLDGKVTFME